MSDPSTNTQRTVLIVDDEAPIRRLLHEFLQRLGYRILEASNAAEALGHLDDGGVDLVLLDLRMPGPADGEDLLFLLRDRGDDVPIIIVSGWIDDDALVHQPDCVQAVLRKPVKMEELTATVSRVLALS